MKASTKALIASASTLSLATAGVCGTAAWALNDRKRLPTDYAYAPFDLNLDAEDVAFESSDGVPLSAWWMDAPGAPALVVIAGGHRSSKCDMLGIGGGLRRAGYSVLLFDARGRGASGEAQKSLGHFERQDLRAAIDWARTRRPELPLVLIGYSMGAAMVLLEAEDAGASAVIADSPFSTATDVMRANMRHYHLPPALVGPSDLFNRVRYHYAYDDLRPIDALGRLECPVLLIHGTDDHIIPFAEAAEMVDANRAMVTLWTAQGADHVGAYFLDRKGYLERVDAFIRSALAGAVMGDAPGR